MSKLAEQMAAAEYWQAPPAIPAERVGIISGGLDSFSYRGIPSVVCSLYGRLERQGAVEWPIPEGQPLQIDGSGSLLKVVRDTRTATQNVDPDSCNSQNFDARAHLMETNPLYAGDTISAMVDTPDGQFVVTRGVFYMIKSLTGRRFGGLSAGNIEPVRHVEWMGKVPVGSVATRAVWGHRAGETYVKYSYASILHSAKRKPQESPQQQPSFVRGVIPGTTN